MRDGNPERLRLRSHGSATLPALIHLPGLHGDWTLLGPFRAALAGRVRFIESTYPRLPEWSLDNYARAIEEALFETGVRRGWIIGESFSSQVAWQFVSRQLNRGEPAAFQVDGLILAGGFVRHPWPWGVWFAHRVSCAIPISVLRLLCKLYGRAAGRRYGHQPEVVAELNEFVERRSNAADRLALNARYQLIANNDPRPVARKSSIPVYQLAGAWDPIVPWWQVRPWLRRHCPGYRASQINWRAGHNVLLSAPEASATQIVAWMKAH